MNQDLNQLSNEELMKIAGIGQQGVASQPAQDLNSLSNEQLMQIAGIQPQQQRSTVGEVARPFLRAAKSAVAGTVGGAADLANLAAELPIYAGHKIAEAGKSLYNKATGVSDQSLTSVVTGNKSNAYKPVFAGNSVTEAINQGFDKATGDLTANRNKTEQYLEIPQEILGGVVGPGAMAKTAKAVGNVATYGSKKLLQKAVGITPESETTLKAFQNSGVSPTLANIAEGQRSKTFQNLLANFPGSSDVIEKATQSQIDDITKQIAGITNSSGGTIQQTGKQIQRGAENLQTIAAKRNTKLYDDLDRFIPQDAAGNKVSVPTNNFANALQDPKIQDVVAVKEGTIKGLVNRYAKLANENGQIPYDRLKIFRGTVGEESYSSLLSPSERGAAKHLYGALSNDMKSAVAATGGERGLQAFNKANNAFYRHLELLDSKINPLVDAKTPEAVYGMALNGSKQGGSNIKVVMKSLDPTQQDFVRGTVAKRMGLAKAGEQDAAGEVFSPDKFLTEWNKLSPEARSNIFTKNQVNSVDNLNRAIFAIKETGKAKQTSNNLPYLQWAGLGGLAVASPASAIATVAGARITAKMMTNPKFINWLAQAPKVKPTEIPKHLKVLSVIASQNPALREDILNYLGSITTENNQEKQNGI